MLILSLSAGSSVIKKNLNINANDYLGLLEISIYKPQARLVDNTGTSSASPAKE
jgi:hypothetical protein